MEHNRFFRNEQFQKRPGILTPPHAAHLLILITIGTSRGRIRGYIREKNCKKTGPDAGQEERVPSEY